MITVNFNGPKKAGQRQLKGAGEKFEY